MHENSLALFRMGQSDSLSPTVSGAAVSGPGYGCWSMWHDFCLDAFFFFFFLLLLLALLLLLYHKVTHGIRNYVVGHHLLQFALVLRVKLSCGSYVEQLG